MAAAAVFAITAMMLILGLFFVISVNINLFTEMLKNNYNEVEVFLADDVTESGAHSIIDQIREYDGVRDTIYRTKEEAMTIMKQRWGENSYLLDSLGENPFPDSIVITVDSMETADRVTAACTGMDGVEDIKYYKETVEKLARISRFLQIAAMMIMVFLVIVSVVIVSNTIKLTVLARSREIEIMKYIGGTNWFIRGPFLVEGIIIGLISSMISAAVTHFLYEEVMEMIGTQMMTIMLVV